MPLNIKLLRLVTVAFGVAVFATSAVAQLPPRPLDHAQPRPAAPRVPWTEGTPPLNEPRRLTTTTYQSPPGDNAAPAPLQSPLPLAKPSNTMPGTDADKPNLKPLATGAASLGLVLGLFLLVVWSVRRGMTKGTGVLPAEAVEVLGRTTIGGRQQVHLVRCGNKLVLLSASGAGVSALTEISDPAEVARLQEICRYSSAPVGAFKQLLGRVNAPSFSAMHAEQLDFDSMQTASYRRA